MDIFIQTHKTSETNFTSPTQPEASELLIFTYQRAKYYFLALAIGHWFFSCLAILKNVINFKIITLNIVYNNYHYTPTQKKQTHIVMSSCHYQLRSEFIYCMF